jgi:hypothetical protein
MSPYLLEIIVLCTSLHMATANGTSATETNGYALDLLISRFVIIQHGSDNDTHLRFNGRL